MQRRSIFLFGALLAGCAARTDAPGNPAPENELSTHPLAAYCDSHTADCRKAYPDCETVVSPWFDEARADGSRCMNEKEHSDVSPFPIVQCVPRSVKGSYTEPQSGWRRVIDPRSGHCVSVPDLKWAPKWTPCEDVMPVCSPTPIVECIKGDDGACYRGCNTSSDCKDPAKPHCSRMGLLMGGDSNCNGIVKVCRANALDDCPG